MRMADTTMKDIRSENPAISSSSALLRLEDCPSVLYGFLEYLLTSQKRSPNTVSFYYHDLRFFFRYLKASSDNIHEIPFQSISIQDVSQETLEKVRFEDVEAYTEYLTKNSSEKSASVKRKLSALRSFFEYLKANHLISQNPCQNPAQVSQKHSSSIYHQNKSQLNTKSAKSVYVDWRKDCPADLRSFLVYMETIKGRSARTISAYYVDLRLFCRYLKMIHGHAENFAFDDIRIEDVSRDMFASVTLTETLEFFSFLMNTRENAVATRARKVSSLHSFYKYLEINHFIQENPIKNLQLPSVPKTLPKHLTLEEARTLLTISNQNTASKRDYCIFTLFLNCGMRLSELIGINLADIQNDRIQITGKGNKQRIAYLNDACQEALAAYIPERQAITGVKDHQALFLSNRKTRITPRGVECVLEKYLKTLGLAEKGYTVHKLRHTAATLMYQYGKVDVRVLQMILGHENLGTTQIYTHVSNQQMEDAVNSSPLSKVEKNINN